MKCVLESVRMQSHLETENLQLLRSGVSFMFDVLSVMYH